KRVIHDADQLSYQLPQHRLVRGRQRRGANALRLDRSAVLSRTEDQVRDTGVEDGLAALLGVQRVDQRKRLVVLISQRAYGTAFDREGRRLRGRQAGRHRRLTSRQREVYRQVMTAKLQHPRGGRRWRPEEGKIVLVF